MQSKVPLLTSFCLRLMTVVVKFRNAKNQLLFAASLFSKQSQRNPQLQHRFCWRLLKFEVKRENYRKKVCFFPSVWSFSLSFFFAFIFFESPLVIPRLPRFFFLAQPHVFVPFLDLNLTRNPNCVTFLVLQLCISRHPATFNATMQCIVLSS